MKRVRVAIDLNSLDNDGLTRTRLSNASGQIHVGQIVTAYESEDEVQALAYVARVDERSGYAHLAVNWESLTDDDGKEILVAPLGRSSVNRAAAAVANAHAAAQTNASTQSQVSFAWMSPTAHSERA